MSGIYIHIPFCHKRCNYCDFYFVTNLHLIEKFLLNLKKEFFLSSQIYKEVLFDTVFFGGGTPTVLSYYQIEDLLSCLNKYFNIDSGAEVSLEANPEDLIGKNFKDYRYCGVNRLSIGIQSFLDSELNFLTRRHTSAVSETILRDVSRYFENVNLDIIYSLPSQTINDIDYSLSKAISLQVNHISAYTLTYEENTPLYKTLGKGEIKKNSNSKEAEFFKFVTDKLVSNAYRHYEISNFAKEGFQCKHNLKYWNYDNYLGFGPSSHSMFDFERWNNYKSLATYNFLLEQSKLPIENRYTLNDEQKNLEYIMLSLRSSGVEYDKYRNIFGKDFREEFKDSIGELMKNKLLLPGNKSLKLNEKGFLLLDEIVAKYF